MFVQKWLSLRVNKVNSLDKNAWTSSIWNVGYEMNKLVVGIFVLSSLC